MSKEVQTKETKETNLPAEMMELMGALPEVDPRDILIPSLFLLQPTSKIDGTTGAIIDRLTGQELGGNGDKINFVPITFFKTWEHFKYDAAQKNKNWVGQELVTPENANLPWTETKDGVKIDHDQVLNFYVFLEKDATDPMGMPYLIKFKRTSYDSGKKLLTFMKRIVAAQMEPWSVVFSVDSVLEKSDEGKYYWLGVEPVMEKNQHKRIPANNMDAIRRWAKIVTTNTRDLAKRNIAEDRPDAPMPQATVRAEKVVNEKEAFPY